MRKNHKTGSEEGTTLLGVGLPFPACQGHGPGYFNRHGYAQMPRVRQTTAMSASKGMSVMGRRYHRRRRNR